MLDLKSDIVLNNAVHMPRLGLGVFHSRGETTRCAVRTALANGYRMVDTARIYCNEKSVGRGLKDSGIPRDEYFVCTKLWRTDFADPRRGLEESLERLQVDYVDLFTLHWPFTGFEQAYLTLERLQEEGLCRAIGVANFRVHHLEALLKAGAHSLPQVNQVECHPLNTENELLGYCGDHDILLEAYSPLGGEGNSLIDDPRLWAIASYLKKTPAQVMLRWNLQRGLAVIPKSVHSERIHQNAQLFDFELKQNEMLSIDSMNQNARQALDPDSINLRPLSFFPEIVAED